MGVHEQPQYVEKPERPRYCRCRPQIGGSSYLGRQYCAACGLEITERESER